MVIDQTLHSIISIIFLITYYSTIGFLLHPLFFSNKRSYRINFNEATLLGLIANIFFLYLWNLFYPINENGFITFVLICLSVGLKYKPIKRIKNVYKNFEIRLIIFLLIITIWIGFLANNKIGPYDLGLYHLHVIKWAENFHIIKGIGNLHHRLGFSCSDWLLASQVNVVFNTNLFLWTHGAIYLIIGFVNFLYEPVFSKNRLKRSEKIIRILYLPILINFCFTSFPGTSSDLPVFFFTSIISLYYFRFIIYKKKNSLNLIFITATLGLSSKLSFGAIIIGLIISLLFKTPEIKSHKKHIPWSILFLSLATLFLWSSRNIITTGYPFYPYSEIAFPVEWKMEKQKVEMAKNQITIHAQGYANLKSLSYVEKLNWYYQKITVQHRRIEIYYPVIIGIFGMISSLFLIKKRLFEIIFLTLPSILPMFLWTQIPNGRFFCSSFWWFGIMLAVYPLVKITKGFKLHYFCFLVILFSISIHTFDRLGSPKNFLPTYNRSKIPEVFTKKITNEEGLTYFKPKSGDQCWDSPLPCTPEPEFWLRNVIQTNQNNLQEGFRVNMK